VRRSRYLNPAQLVLELDRETPQPPFKGTRRDCRGLADFCWEPRRRKPNDDGRRDERKITLTTLADRRGLCPSIDHGAGHGQP